jgi:hypothetical protein
MSAAAIAKRLRALEQRKRVRLPATALIVIGSSAADIAAQHARAIAEGRAKAGEPFISIMLAGSEPSDRRAGTEGLTDTELEAIAGDGRSYNPAVRSMTDAELLGALLETAP